MSAANTLCRCLPAGRALHEADLRGVTPADRDDIARPLAALLRACHEEAELSPLGRAALHWDVGRALANLRRLAAEEAAAPAILEEPIRSPLVITGMPRSGTSYLHALLAADPAALTPRCWQVVWPYPDASAARRQRQMDRQFAVLNRLAPRLQDLHPVDSRSPQECTEITAQVFQSLRFETIYRIPSYKRFLSDQGHLPAYRFHRRFLRHLQHQADGRRSWVLKCPDHVFALDALLAVYPDARVVFLHRDPLHVLPSVAQLTETLRAPFTRRIDRADIGRQVLEDWARGAEIMTREARHPRLPAGRVLHLRFQDVTARPLETACLIYRQFGLDLTPEAEASMARLVAARPRGRYGENRYDLATHGLDRPELRSRFADYARLFGVAAEEPARPPARASARPGKTALSPALPSART